MLLFIINNLYELFFLYNITTIIYNKTNFKKIKNIYINHRFSDTELRESTVLDLNLVDKLHLMMSICYLCSK